MFDKQVSTQDQSRNEVREMVELEMKRFMNLPVTDRHLDTLQWWQSQGKANFPCLFKIAMKYLIIPATSVPSERVFSAAGEIISKKRNRLLPENASMLIMLNGNIDLI